jgi:pilin isopeptide linkage protein
MEQPTNRGLSLAQRVIAVMLAAILCMTIMVSTSFAWGFVTSKLNEWFNNQDYHEAILQKYEQSPDGVGLGLPGARFELYFLEGDSEETTRTQIGGIYTTDQDGRISVGRLARGRYVFVEVSPPFGYEFETDPETKTTQYEYFFTLPSVTRPHADVISYNHRIDAPLSITKTIVNQDASLISEAQRQKEFTFLFLLDPERSTSPVDISRSYVLSVYDTSIPGIPLIETITIKSGETFVLRHGQKAIVQGLPVGIFYEIVELSSGEYAVSSSNNQGHLLEDGCEVEFVNTRLADSLGSLNVRKLIAGSESAEDDHFVFEIEFDTSHVPDFDLSQITFSRRHPDNPGMVSVETTGTIQIAAHLYSTTLTMRANDVISFDDLPFGLIYTIREIDSNGYTSDGYQTSGTIIKPTGEVITITNHKGDLPDEDWEIEIEKRVLDLSENQAAEADKEFEFTIRFSDTGLESAITTGTVSYRITYENGVTVDGTVDHVSGELIFRLRAGDRIVFTGNEVEDIHYEIEETDYRDDYYFGSAFTRYGVVRRGLTLVFEWENVFRPPIPEVPAKLRITKTVEGEHQDPLHIFEFELVFEGEEPIYFTLMAGETKSFDTAIGKSYVVRELLSSDEGYILVGVVNGQGTITLDVLIEGVSFRNRYTLPITIDIEGEKSWNLHGLNVELPDSIEILLINASTGAIIDRKVVTAEDGWLFCFEGVDKYDSDGNEILYKIEEMPKKHYTPDISCDESGYYTVTNTYIVPITVTTPAVKKSVNPSSAPTVTFRFVLKALDGAPVPHNGNGQEQTITITGEGIAQFGTLAFAEEGIYRYEITEVSGNAPGYTYDKTVYELVYHVTLEETEMGISLVPRATLTRKVTGDSVDYALFTNVYKEPVDETLSDSQNPEVGKTGDDIDISPVLVLGIIAMGTLWLALLIRRRPD